MPELPVAKEVTRSGCLLAIRKLLAIRSPGGDPQREGEGRRSSTPTFWDMHPPAQYKNLPMLPPDEPAPPLPLAARRYRAETRPPLLKKSPKRAISWSEDQINRLQQDNRDLRQKILEQKRTDVEKDQTIAFLTQQNAQYRQEIDRNNDVSQFANTVIVAVQEFQQARSRRSVNSSNYGDAPKGVSTDSNTIGDALSDIIRIYTQI